MKAIVFLADGFEECEGLIVVDILRRAGVETIMASIMGRLEIDSSRHIGVKADTLASDVDYNSVDIIILPGGRLGTENLSKCDLVKELCVRFASDNYVAAICAAPSILAELCLLEEKEATCHPDYESAMNGAILTGKSVTVDGSIITGQGLGTTFEFAFELARILVGEEKVQTIKKAICFRQ